MKAKISDWQLFNSSRSSTKSWRKVNPSQSVLGCYLSVLVSSCPGVLVSWSQPVLILYGQVMARLGPAWITIRSGGGQPHIKRTHVKLDNTHWGTHVLSYCLCVFFSKGDASNIEQPFEKTTIRSAARQGGRGSLIAVHYAVGICALPTQCHCTEGGEEAQNFFLPLVKHQPGFLGDAQDRHVIGLTSSPYLACCGHIQCGLLGTKHNILHQMTFLGTIQKTGLSGTLSHLVDTFPLWHFGADFLFPIFVGQTSCKEHSAGCGIQHRGKFFTILLLILLFINRSAAPYGYSVEGIWN